MLDIAGVWWIFLIIIYSVRYRQVDTFIKATCMHTYAYVGRFLWAASRVTAVGTGIYLQPATADRNAFSILD